MLNPLCMSLVCVLGFNANANIIRDDDLYQLDIVHYNDFHDRPDGKWILQPMDIYRIFEADRRPVSIILQMRRYYRGLRYYASCACNLVDIPCHLTGTQQCNFPNCESRFEETSVVYPICKSNDSSCLGGFARLYQEVHELMRQKPDALLLNAGDTYQGTYWYALLKWNITQKFINMLPNDAHALGNHEFDDGVSGLAPYMKALKAPVVAANLEVDVDSPLYGLYKSHVVVERRGRKIGIVGLITKRTEMLAISDGVKFLEPIPVVQKEAQLLSEKGIDIIVVLSHCGLGLDKKIASEVGDNIDIIVGGHTHSLLWNGESPSNEKIEGPYPVLVESKSKPGHKVLIVTASAFSKYLGNMTAYFDKTGELQSFEGSPVFLNRSIPEDPQIKSLLQPYSDQLHELVREVVGYATDELSMESCGAKECALGNLFADAFLNKSAEMYPTNLSSIAMLQRNMIRSSIPKGDITRGTVINTSPFTNKVQTFILAGRYLFEALEQCITSPWERNPYNGPYTPQVAGMRVTLNTTSGKVMSVLVREGEEYSPLDLDKDYQVTSLDFLTRGGNGFKMFKDNKRNLTTIGTEANVLEEYIRKASPITPQLDNRLTLLS